MNNYTSEPSTLVYGIPKDGEFATKLRIRTNVVLPSMIYEQIMIYIRSTDLEVSGLGHATEVNGNYIISDICLPKQNGSAGGTTLDEGDVARLMVEKIKNGDSRPYNFWWHSHVNMGTFWSQTDDNNCERLVSLSKFLISIVGTQNGNMLCRIDVNERFKYTVDKVPICIQGYAPTQRQKGIWEKEVSTNMKEKRIIFNRDTNMQLWTPQKGERQITPRPQRTRTLYGTTILYNKINGWEADIQHDNACHTHSEGLGCEDCVQNGCMKCLYNMNSRRNGKRKRRWALT